MTANEEDHSRVAIKDEGETMSKDCDKGKKLRFYRLIIPYNL